MAVSDEQTAPTSSLYRLPFCRQIRGKGWDCWAVDPPEAYEDACDYGESLALALLRYRPGQQDRFPEPIHQVIRWIVFSQIARGAASKGEQGALVGFWGVIGRVVEGVASPEFAEGIARLLERNAEETARRLAAWGMTKPPSTRQ